MPVDFTALKNELVAQSRLRAETAAQRMTADLKRTAPVETGELQRQTGVEVTSATRQRITATALMDTSYAEYVRFGTRPHVIVPRRARALRFTVGGRTVFAAKVNHPGTTANPFFDEVINRWERYLQSA